MCKAMVHSYFVSVTMYISCCGELPSDLKKTASGCRNDPGKNIAGFSSEKESVNVTSKNH